MNKTLTEVWDSFIQRRFIKPIYTEQSISDLVWALDGSTVCEIYHSDRLSFDKGAIVKIKGFKADQTVESLGIHLVMEMLMHKFTFYVKCLIIVVAGCLLTRRPWWRLKASLGDSPLCQISVLLLWWQAVHWQGGHGDGRRLHSQSNCLCDFALHSCWNGN